MKDSQFYLILWAIFFSAGMSEPPLPIFFLGMSVVFLTAWFVDGRKGDK